MLGQLSRTATIIPRMFVVMGIVVLIVFSLPKGYIGSFELTPDVGFWIYALLITFLVEKGITRKDTLRENVLLELTHIRHLHHVSESLLDPKFQKKFDKVLIEYQESIEDNFVNYRDSSSCFRKVSHMIYEYVPQNSLQEQLHADLFSTVGDLAVVRQTIIHNLYKRLAPFYWVMVFMTIFCLTLLMVLNFEGEMMKKIGLCLSLFTVYIPMEMFIRTSQNSKRTMCTFAHQYHKNIEKINAENKGRAKAAARTGKK